jgi:predicted phage terminase large subunit-like protein
VSAVAEASNLDASLRAAKRLLKAKKARDSLIAYTEFTMPHPSDPEDSDLSRYSAQYFHKALAATLEEVVAGRIKRLLVTFPPRHGKSELTSKKLISWFLGKYPHLSTIFGTYNQEFADDFGRAVRDTMKSAPYRQVFPGVSLKQNSQAADRMETEQGGNAFFVGRGGSVTGRGGNGIIIDDPLKNSDEADSANVRNDLWTWLQNDIFSRFMDDKGWAVMIMTRWHEDDPIGRLTDPNNPHYDAEEAKQWMVFNIPAIAEENDVLGRAPGAPLWPERFGLDYLLSFKRRNPRGFNALYQQRPTAEDGDFFKAEHIVTYLPHELPPLNKLRIYAASDHAVAQKQENDRTCILIVGVDENDNIWLLDCWWKRAKTDEVVEKIIFMLKRWRPLKWWAEEDHIVKSIGPFLKKRMREEKVYLGFSKVNGYIDKVKKAQAIQGRLAMDMVLFPVKAPWFQDAKDELLKFPRAAHDDFVDTLATIGRGLGVIVAPAKPAEKPQGPAVGTWGWMKKAAKDQARNDKVRLNLAST